MLLASLMLFTGSSTPATAEPGATPPQAKSQYDGEAVFRGVLLDDGPVARLFPEIWENPVIVGYRDHADLAGQPTEAVQLLIAALRSQDSSFFDRFGTEMQSGDHIRILRAIDEGGDRLKKLAGDLAQDSVKSGLPIYEARALYHQTVLFHESYAYVQWYAYTVVAAFLFLVIGGVNGQTGSVLQRDQLVDLVSTRLGPQASTAR